MSSLENLNCPQFVDFTSPDAFDINDGADFFFDKGVVGQIDLGFGLDLGFKTYTKPEEDDKPDKMQELVDKLKTMTSFNPTKGGKQPLGQSTKINETEDKQQQQQESNTTPTPPECVAVYKSNKHNKENQAAQLANKPLKNDQCSNTFSIQTPTVTKLTKQNSLEDKKTDLKQRILNPNTTPVIENKNSSQSNIVKKTFAKMTAAFKHKDLSIKKLDNKKKNVPIKAEQEMFTQKVLSPQSDDEQSNRRASSVPRTLREKQALKKQGIVILENLIDNQNVTKDDSSKENHFEHKSLKQRVAPPTAILSLASSAKKKNLTKQQLEDRRRSRSCNESINKPKPNRIRQPTNESTDQKPKKPASPIINQIKPRPRSGERVPMLPMYTGVKFVPKIHSHKFSETSGYAPLIQPAQNQTTLPLEDVLKQRPVCLQKRNISNIKLDLNKKPLLANRSVTGKSASFKYNVNNTSQNQPKPATSSSNVSLVKGSASDHNLNSSQSVNTSVSNPNSSRMRKKSETKPTPNGFLHTELRALKRNEYDQSMKEKEKIANQMKHDLDAEKLKKQQEEIQKIRMARTFRSNPIKHYKPVDLKPSEKALTEPKSPNMSMSTTKINSSTYSKNDSFTARTFSSLVDAPMTSNKTNNSNLFRSNSLLRNNGLNKHRNLTVSHDDIRF